MLATVILGIAAGFGAPYAEPLVKDWIKSLLLSDVPMTDLETRMFSFAICLVGAAILAYAFGNGSGLALAIGAAMGVFGPRIIDRIQKKKTPDYGDDL